MAYRIEVRHNASNEPDSFPGDHEFEVSKDSNRSEYLDIKNGDGETVAVYSRNCWSSVRRVPPLAG